MTTESGPRPARFETLDGLRGVAALAVAASHAPSLFRYEVPNANLAVDFFFALSGFVIAYAYGAKLRTGLSPFRFVVLRTIRLYPLYGLGTILGVLVTGAGLAFKDVAVSADHMLAVLLPAAAMLPTVGLAPVLYVFNPPAWSLFFELLANIGYAAFHRLVASRWWMLGGLAVSGAALVAIGRHLGSLDVGWETGPEAFGGLARVGFSFIAGAAVFQVYRRRPPAFSPRPWVFALILLAVLAAPLKGSPLLLFQCACIAVVFPLVLYFGAGSRPRRGEAGAWLFLGSASYAVYALHWPLYQLVDRGLSRVAGVELSAWAPWSGFLFLAVTLSVADLADRLYDRPVRRLLVRWSDGFGARAAALLAK